LKRRDYILVSWTTYIRQTHS